MAMTPRDERYYDAGYLAGFRAAREAAAEVLVVQVEMAGNEADAAMVGADWSKVDRERHLLKHLRSTLTTINAIPDPSPAPTSSNQATGDEK